MKKREPGEIGQFSFVLVLTEADLILNKSCRKNFLIFEWAFEQNEKIKWTVLAWIIDLHVF